MGVARMAAITARISAVDSLDHSMPSIVAGAFDTPRGPGVADLVRYGERRPVVAPG